MTDYIRVFIAPILLALFALACGTVVHDQAYYTCPTPYPRPTATVLWGTPLPPPTLPPTPYNIIPPQDFYVGDAVFVGQRGATMRLRFRVQNVQVQPTGSRQLVMWHLEIRNVGTTTYETIPPALMLITRIITVNGEQIGAWQTSEQAMREAGFTDENYDPLPAGMTRIYHLAAYIPSGNVRQFAYLLDGDGGNRITWANQTNPDCLGDVSDY